MLFVLPTHGVNKTVNEIANAARRAVRRLREPVKPIELFPRVAAHMHTDLVGAGHRYPFVGPSNRSTCFRRTS
jgi:hypothetical protein